MSVSRFRGTRPAYPSADLCPDAKTHTPHPKNYLGHAAWAEEKMRTHNQTQCPTCGFWAIWVPKGAS